MPAFSVLLRECLLLLSSLSSSIGFDWPSGGWAMGSASTANFLASAIFSAPMGTGIKKGSSSSPSSKTDSSGSSVCSSSSGLACTACSRSKEFSVRLYTCQCPRLPNFSTASTSHSSSRCKSSSSKWLSPYSSPSTCWVSWSTWDSITSGSMDFSTPHAYNSKSLVSTLRRSSGMLIMGLAAASLCFKLVNSSLEALGRGNPPPRMMLSCCSTVASALLNSSCEPVLR
mmetsp:Transcript_14384/g.38981  ORF Transcript_14384/g.38981 Transcript_14384/m.38981 type:complete len:228 (+) Transcript_14384:1556-2239(+)